MAPLVVNVFLCLVIGSSNAIVVNRSHESLTSVPPGISTSTTELYLNDNFISNIPDNSFITLTILVKLDLSANGIIAIGSAAFSGTKLHTLLLGKNMIMTLPSLTSISATINLLDLNYNLIGDIAGLKNLLNLTTLNLEYNIINEDPNVQYFMNTGLVTLDLTDCTLANIPNLIHIASTITQLELDKNIIERISDSSLKHMVSLKTLYLEKNQIREIAKSAFFNTSIGTLHLHENLLTEVPYILDICPTLTTLTLQGNNISYINLTYFQGCDLLANLNLGNNKFTKIADFGTLLSSLSDLDITSLTFACCEVMSLKYVSNLLVDPAPCTSPAAYVGTPWVQLTAVDLNIPCTDCPACIPGNHGNGISGGKLCIFKSSQVIDTSSATLVKTRSMIHCSQICHADQSCLAINYHQSDKTCILMDHVVRDHEVKFSLMYDYGVVQRGNCTG